MRAWRKALEALRVLKTRKTLIQSQSQIEKESNLCFSQMDSKRGNIYKEDAPSLFSCAILIAFKGIR